MASGEVWSVLEECVKKINAITAQPENFLRQVFAVFVPVLSENLFKRRDDEEKRSSELTVSSS